MHQIQKRKEMTTRNPRSPCASLSTDGSRTSLRCTLLLRDCFLELRSRHFRKSSTLDGSAMISSRREGAIWSGTSTALRGIPLRGTPRCSRSSLAVKTMW